MANLFERVLRGFAAARQAMGSDTIAETNRFDLTYSGYFPRTILRRRRDDGEIIVEVELGGAHSVMTPPEFARFADELSAFKQVVAAADEAAQRMRG
jgi:hypothetical protein